MSKENQPTDEYFVAFDDEVGMARYKLIVWEEESPYWTARVAVEINIGESEDDSASRDLVVWATREASAAVRRVIEAYRDGQVPPPPETP